MPKFKVKVPMLSYYVYQLEADTPEQAKEKVLNGEIDEFDSTDFIVDDQDPVQVEEIEEFEKI